MQMSPLQRSGQALCAISFSQVQSVLLHYLHRSCMLLIPTGSVENERSFSDVTLLKSKIRNRMEEEHLNACHRVRRCRFTMGDFPYNAVIASWLSKGDRRMVHKTS